MKSPSPLQVDEDISLDILFPEPPRPPSPEATVAVYTRSACDRDDTDTDGACPGVDTESKTWREIKIQLVGTHPLWGHYLWNAARATASYLDAHSELYYGKMVLEVGAGGGLPGIVCAKNGARHVTLTDYPDPALIKNLEYNVDMNISISGRDRVDVQGYIWGRDVRSLLKALPNNAGGFDVIIMSDLIFNHSQHEALLATCGLALTNSNTPIHGKGLAESPTSVSVAIDDHITAPCVLTFYTHHRPHLAHLDLQFFEKARMRGWDCKEILTQNFHPMFPDDPGDESVRSTVHGWSLSRHERRI